MHIPIATYIQTLAEICDLCGQICCLVLSNSAITMRLAHNTALTIAAQPIPIEQVACSAAAVEAANGVGTHLFTSTISRITLINI